MDGESSLFSIKFRILRRTKKQQQQQRATQDAIIVVLVSFYYMLLSCGCEQRGLYWGNKRTKQHNNERKKKKKGKRRRREKQKIVLFKIAARHDVDSNSLSFVAITLVFTASFQSHQQHQQHQFVPIPAPRSSAVAKHRSTSNFLPNGSEASITCIIICIAACYQQSIDKRMSLPASKVIVLYRIAPLIITKYEN